jgi:hypothetical protein
MLYAYNITVYMYVIYVVHVVHHVLYIMYIYISLGVYVKLHHEDTSCTVHAYMSKNII